ncbi:MAG: hypothetical protein KatS3mg035_2057 [Bacteroidia bacterium]|nr:MAG: hypothetical protein KatS3mg035_2057 [Bacteroidia bacterium]
MFRPFSLFFLKLKTTNYKITYLKNPKGNIMAAYKIAKDSLFLTELPMYGEKRLGEIKENRFLMKKPTQNGIVTPVIVTASKPPAKTSIYPLGKKHYESTDRLGNVRVTYTDKKSWQQNKFALNVSSSQDYYPFGSVMEGRGKDSVNYRYGFNDKEKVNEIYGAGNAYDFGARLYESRLGRWIIIDPSCFRQPEYSLYKAFKNNPIIFIDPDGKTEFITIITVNKQTGDTKIEQIQANRIMTDGVKHEVRGFGDTWYYVNNYYDYRTVIYRTIEKDGRIEENKISEIVYENGIKGQEYVFFGGDKAGEIKTDGWFRWIPEINDIGGLIIYGSAGSSEDSPGTPTKNKIWGSFDFAEFSSTMGLILTAVKTKEENTLKPGFNGQKAAELMNKVKNALEYVNKNQRKSRKKVCTVCHDTLDIDEPKSYHTSFKIIDLK